jgi:hypothetical protein
MLHKLISPFVGLLFVLTMSSCSGEDAEAKDTSTPSGKPTSQSEPAAPVETDTQNPDEIFIGQLHEAIPETLEGNEADYIRLAGEFCGYLDDGYTPQGVVKSWSASGGNAESASTMLKIAVPIYCPQHTKLVEVNLS